MARVHFRVWIALVCAVFIASLRGDQVRLSDGSMKEGEVILQTETNITLRQKYPGNITVERDIDRKLIIEIIKDTEDMAAYKKLADLPLKNPSSLPLVQYNNAISNQFLPFLAKYPGSAMTTNAQARMAAIIRDRDAVAAGGVKFNGRWYTALQTRRRAFDFKSLSVYTEIVQARAAGNHSQVAGKWDNFEKEFDGSLYTAMTLDEALRALKELESSISKRIQDAKDSQEASQKKINEANSTMQNIRPREHKEESGDRLKTWKTDRYGRRIDDDSKTWYGYTGDEQRALDQAKKDSEQERTRMQQSREEAWRLQEQQYQLPRKIESLQRLKSEDMEKSCLLTEKAESLLDEGKKGDAQDMLKKARSLWNKNHLAGVLLTEIEIGGTGTTPPQPRVEVTPVTPTESGPEQPRHVGNIEPPTPVPLQAPKTETTKIEPPPSQPPPTHPVELAPSPSPPTETTPAPVDQGSSSTAQNGTSSFARLPSLKTVLLVILAVMGIIVVGFFLLVRHFTPPKSKINAAPPMAAPGVTAAPGQTLGDYKIEERIGQGGMGMVFRAHQISLQRPVALKTLSPELGANKAYVDRFLREARAAAQLNHPNIIQIYDAGQSNGTYYFAMELVDGKNLRQILKDQGGRVEEREALILILQAAEGLAFAHSRGLVHRDVKLDNLMLTSQGNVKVLDLGLAKWIGDDQGESLTMSGAMMGSPHYMSPEQIRGQKDIDARTDVYALGMTLYQLLAGKPAFNKDSATEIMMQHLSDEIPSLREASPETSEATIQLVQEMIVKGRDQRIQDMQTVIQRINAILGIATT